ncbi:hypothetical protein PG985_008323 [Apiospora marii]|uniref:Uncharacterized protein n=1 Tax=Apiospora marii TaxID=335849 RepID=A0ABR1SRN5_9PEZI
MNALERECALSIAHLFMLNRFPGPLRTNSLTDAPVSGRIYALPFEWEIRLTSILAFLSSVSGNPRHVTAVCIKEHHQEQLDVLLAINKGKPDDGESILREVQNGFAKLFKILSQNNAEPIDNEDRIFDTVISMCHKRILRRLKLRGVKPGKPSIKGTLEHGRQAIQEAGETSEFSVLVEKFEKIESLVDAWLIADEAHKSDKAPLKLLKLKEIVVALHGLQQRPGLTSMMGKIPPTANFASTLNASLLDIIEKVAMYRACIPYLRQLETGVFLLTKRSLFGRMRIVLAKLPTEAFDRTPADHLEANLASKIPEDIPGSERAEFFEMMCKRLRNKEGKPTKDPNGDQVKIAKDTLTKGKVHAEIQLLFHCYELGQMELPPRVVSSSKDACYLCDAFISLHGKMYVPASHGTIYYEWRLPKVGNDDLHSRFVEHLDGLIRESRKHSLFPAESHIATGFDLVWHDDVAGGRRTLKKTMPSSGDDALRCLDVARTAL